VEVGGTQIARVISEFQPSRAQGGKIDLTRPVVSL
jgi:hypothetical protein